jgi:hypothetical protein
MCSAWVPASLAFLKPVLRLVETLGRIRKGEKPTEAFLSDLSSKFVQLDGGLGILDLLRDPAGDSQTM